MYENHSIIKDFNRNFVKSEVGMYVIALFSILKCSSLQRLEIYSGISFSMLKERFKFKRDLLTGISTV